MRISKSFGTSTYSPVNFLWDGADALSSGGLAGAVQSLKLSDLIIYENWTKN